MNAQPAAADSRNLSSQDRRYHRHRRQRRLSRRHPRGDAQCRSRKGASDPDRRVPAGTANQRQHLPDPFEGTYRDRRHRIGQLFAAHSRLRSAQPRIGRDRSEVDRYGLADPHASGSFRRPDRHVERAASVSERGTGDARERAGALVRRRRDGEGRRAIGAALFSWPAANRSRPTRTGRDCSGRARCFPA